MELVHLIQGKASPVNMNRTNLLVHELAQQQVNGGMNVTVWGITDDTIHEYPQRNFKSVLFDRKKLSSFSGSDLAKAIRQAKGKDVIFHLHGAFLETFHEAAKLMRTCKLPYIVTPHGGYQKAQTPAIWQLGRRRLMRREAALLAGAAAVHVEGISELEGVHQVCRNCHASIIPFGFSGEINNGLTTTPSGHEGQFIVGYDGRADMHGRGLDALLEGFELFSKYVPEARLWIFGDTAHLQPVREIVAQLGMGSKVYYPGAKYGPERDILHQQVHVFVYPSRSSGTPSTLLETCARGIPCVVTEATNVGSYVKAYHAGIVLSEVSAVEVATGLQKIAYAYRHEQQRTELRKNAARMVHTAFDWKKIVSEYSDMYNEALTGNWSPAGQAQSTLWNKLPQQGKLPGAEKLKTFTSKSFSENYVLAHLMEYSS